MSRSSLVAVALLSGISGLILDPAEWGVICFAQQGPIAQAADTSKARKRALLIGISQYERQPTPKQPPDWWNLSCEGDVKALQEVLMKTFSFPAQDILVLTNEKATRDGIVNAFRTHLIEGARPGDVVYLHFSGHGQRIADDNDDEFDGQDESLIPFDYKTQSAVDGAATNLRDDMLGELLGQLQSKMSVQGKLVGSITFTLDCCFSGTATRGDPPEGRLTARGRGWMPIDGPEPSPSGRGQPDSGGGLLTRGDAAAQGYVFITASSHDQLAKEWSDPERGKMGAMTSFLVRELERATPQTTYRALFEKMDANLRAVILEQNPQLEGSADALLFSGTAVPRPAYVVVERVTGDTLTLPAGEVHGVRSGSVFHIYAAGGDVTKIDNRIADAVVTQTQGASCTAQLTEAYRGKLDASALRAARAVEAERAYGGEELLRVFVAEGVPAALVAEVAKVKVATTKEVTADNFDIRIRPDPDNTGLMLLERKAAVFDRLEVNAENAPTRLREALRNAWQTRFLLRLENPDAESLVQVDLRVVPAAVTRDAQGRVVSATRRADVKETDGQTLVAVEGGDYLMLEIRNRSERLAAHVTILHFPADGSVYCLYPEFDGENVFPSDPEKWVSLGRRFVFQAEHNKKLLKSPEVEAFKLIATREPSNYRKLLPSRSAPTRSADDVRREITNHPGRGGARGGKASNYDLARLLATAALGEDPDRAYRERSQLLPVVVTDWNTAAVKVETRPAPTK